MSETMTDPANTNADDRPTATLYHVHAEVGHEWHDGAGYYYVDDEYAEEGSMGAFATEEEAREHAETAWDPPYRVTGQAIDVREGWPP